MKLYNTLTREKEEFVPVNEGEVKMYSCGPTVYNYFHIGNARPFIIFDTLRKYFEYKGYKVKFVQNFTDIDDKMIENANGQGIDVKKLADKFINEYFTDAEGLGIEAADVHPKATETIGDIIRFVKKLVEKGFAYEASGDVYFNTSKLDRYGKLSGQNLEELEAGARVDVGEKKKNPADFTLWKAQKPGEPAWDSPWGKGRPGWHIECSVMANKYLGETIDIHSGGQDLIFPHHENEIAQSESANGKPFARYWLHNGFLNVDNQKMSKSLGNFFTVRDISKHFDYEVIRFFMLTAHYRSPINFSSDQLQQAKNGLDRIYNFLDNLNYLKDNTQDREFLENEKAVLKTIGDLKNKFLAAMDDDINTADAVASIFEMVRQGNTKLSGSSSKKMVIQIEKTVKELCGVLNIAQKQSSSKLDDEVEALIEKRQQARKDKNYKLADEIRDQLKSMDIELQDTPQGVKWKKV